MNGDRNTLIKQWFWPALGLLWAFALTTRFWGLERFDTLVFDEVYFAKFAHNYLTQTEFFDGHPPLGKYLIAIGIGLQGYSTWGFRWMNALVGSWIPLVVAGIAFQLTRRHSYALVAGLCVAFDGLLLVESRYALLNVYLIFWGLMAHLLFLWGLHQSSQRRWIGLGLAGVCIGATAAVKWNGLGFWLGLWGLWLVSGLLSWVRALPPQAYRRSAGLSLKALASPSPLSMVLSLGAIAFIGYGLLWIPHIHQIPTYDFAAVHDQIFSYHQRVGSGPDVHPYCAAWYTWPLMLRPLSYFYQRTTTLHGPVPVYGPPQPADGSPWIFDVHAMGNPPLWWAATFALIFMVGMLGRWVQYLGALWIQGPCSPSQPSEVSPASALLCPPLEQLVVPLYVSVNYAANLLPWTLVSRCTFLYHYMPASLFSGLAIAWVIDQWLQRPYRWSRLLALSSLSLFALGFWWWSPIYLGLPLSQTAWAWRMFIPSWR